MTENGSSTKRKKPADPLQHAQNASKEAQIREPTASALEDAGHIAAKSSTVEEVTEDSIFHAWPVKKYHDIEVSIPSYPEHYFRLHKQMLCHQSEFFMTAISQLEPNGCDSLTLPEAFRWFPMQLCRFFDGIYGKYDAMIVKLAGATDNQKFIALLHPANTEMTLSNGETAKITGHNPDGSFNVVNSSTNTAVHNVLITDTSISCTQSAFQGVIHDDVDLLNLLQLSDFFTATRMIDILPPILMRLVQIGSGDIAIEIAAIAERMSLNDLHTACIARLAEFTLEKEHLLRIPPALLAELYLKLRTQQPSHASTTSNNNSPHSVR